MNRQMKMMDTKASSKRTDSLERIVVLLGCVDNLIESLELVEFVGLAVAVESLIELISLTIA
jgi:hypothetical protein